MPAAQTSPGRWTAGVIAGLLVLTPLLGWAGSLGFAPAVALAGLLTALSVRIRTEDRALLLALFTALVWACASAFWSPWRPADLDEQTGLKLVFMLALYGCAVSAARAVPEARLPRLLSGLATVAGVLALLLLFEALTSAAGYKVLLGLIGQAVRPDYAIKNVAQGLYVLTLLAPPALAAVSGRTRWILGLVLGAGIIGPALVFGYDAPLLALACAILAAGLVLGLPSLGPRLLAGLSAGGFLLAPVLAKGAFALGLDERIAPLLSESWLQRLGYWGKAVDWIWARPLPGWGLDASRAFGPGIQLHPHNAPLQIWMELGLIGAVAAAIVWASIFSGLSRPVRTPAAAAATATAVAYLIFGAVSFGVWQEWWLALGALSALACILVLRARPIDLSGRSV
ncbi:MAG: O-antigen ligase family protein [Alphaproteobacteria bacterium]|uniref:O-antigen ligase family protein n=1 Tax=Phenylobacterium sp. TaxID=1871053 RepID=UPI0025E48D2B|nr:O-antigen ligase family protein [Phenylobacterium sp.]MCA3724717.1 O-antigen ligase family protein [Phenylobacterium sp.]MCA3758408.1 O-antigen ligase family protein [Phenylobacterium sp.]MCA6259844.1 O-antigen ligase family protein [Phenylobacterium sp.]MCE2818630.1 O-antigen ligase family protein [Phenylobacterium sp.]